MSTLRGLAEQAQKSMRLGFVSAQDGQVPVIRPPLDISAPEAIARSDADEPDEMVKDRLIEDAKLFQALLGGAIVQPGGIDGFLSILRTTRGRSNAALDEVLQRVEDAFADGGASRKAIMRAVRIGIESAGLHKGGDYANALLSWAPTISDLTQHMAEVHRTCQALGVDLPEGIELTYSRALETTRSHEHKQDAGVEADAGVEMEGGLLSKLAEVLGLKVTLGASAKAGYSIGRSDKNKDTASVEAKDAVPSSITGSFVGRMMGFAASAGLPLKEFEGLRHVMDDARTLDARAVAKFRARLLDFQDAAEKTLSIVDGLRIEGVDHFISEYVRPETSLAVMESLMAGDYLEAYKLLQLNASRFPAEITAEARASGEVEPRESFLNLQAALLVAAVGDSLVEEYRATDRLVTAQAALRDKLDRLEITQDDIIGADARGTYLVVQNGADDDSGYSLLVRAVAPYSDPLFGPQLPANIAPGTIIHTSGVDDETGELKFMTEDQIHEVDARRSAVMQDAREAAKKVLDTVLVPRQEQGEADAAPAAQAQRLYPTERG